MKQFVHTRDFLVDRYVVEHLNELPAQWLARLLVAELERAGMTDLEVGGLENSDCASAPIHSVESTEELIGTVHFLGLYADAQSFCRFSIVDYTHESRLIATARHMVTTGEVVHCEVNLSMPAAAW